MVNRGSLYSLLEARASTFGERECLVDEQVRWTWSDLLRRVQELAGVLHERGVVPGDRVAILRRNSADYMALYFAVAAVEAMVVPLNYWLRSSELDILLSDTAPRLVIADGEFVSVLDNSTWLAGAGVDVLNTADLTSGPSTRLNHSYDPEPDAPYSIFYTGGTSGGRAKGAVHTQHQAVLNGLSTVVALGFSDQDTLIVHTPMFHVGGWDYAKALLLAGGRLVIVSKFDEDTILSTIEREQVTALLGMPAIFRMLTSHEAIDRYNLKSLRLLFVGGSVVTKELLEEAPARMGLSATSGFMQVYGQTEAGPLATVLAPADAVRKLGSAGKPVVTARVEILDEAGSLVPRGVTGEIAISGPDVMIGFWNNPDDTARVLRDGWLRTGDLGYLDEDGYLYIVGRKKDMIISAGENIYPTEVEEAIRAHADVVDVAVIGVPDPVMEEAVFAVVETEHGAELDRDMLSRFVRERIAGYKVPKHFEFVESLPRSIHGKVVKHELSAQYGTVFDA